ncbi:type II secretion system minor pseudopilin GspJ [Tamilnaduibacter salinus]|nr:type II secretion system minor pseudopilin GspJ [Tamilnaduibacter salinus]
MTGVARQNGFTLMEMLIAVGITALIGIGVWQMVNGVITSRDRVDAAAGQFERLQKTMLLLERDIGQVVNRPVRDIYGDWQPAFSSREEAWELVVTRQGWRNPTGARRSRLQRAAWEFTGDELRRRYWPMLDRGQDTEGRDQLLLEGVTDLAIRFMDRQRNWRENWPADQRTASGQSGDAPADALPLGVEVTLTHEDFGEIRRVFVLPDFDRSSVQSAIDIEAAAQAGSGEAANRGNTESGNGGS